MIKEFLKKIKKIDKLEQKNNNQCIFKYTNRISIELSNLCNYSFLHKKCPLNKIKIPKILSEKIVNHILYTCKKYNFQGAIAFHTYNEPGIDPRLMMFINKTKLILPKSKIILQTNGFYLDQILAKEYEKNGVNIIRISAYSQKEYIRLSKIKLKIPIIVTMQILDDRLNIRSHLEIDNKKPCYAPLNEIIVTNEGKISLCCLDWERKYIFGDLYKQTLKEILQNKKIFEVYKKLSTGNRFLDICKKCDWQR
ncbi:SPASM domain-containing protein [Candidatus Parcubacteria bacterium]|nr:SPASM domain-containing protein [Candidatus Parcubacteria bacterium]